MAAEIVALTQDADHGHHRLQLHIPMCPISKPSVSYGPGRGGPRGWFRCYVDTSVRKKMQEFHAHVMAASNSQGFVTIPRNMPVGMKIWFFLKRPASDFVSRRRGENCTTLLASHLNHLEKAYLPGYPSTLYSL